MSLNIRKYGDKILQQKTVKIKDPLDKEIQSLIPQMFEAMYAEKGVGLAAPQIGKSLRMCVIEDQGVKYILINPKISSYSKENVIMEEGCLSFPGEFYQIERPEEVKVRYVDETGARKKIKAGGLLGRALQHEIDHLDGILIIDRVNKNERKKTH